MSTSRNYSQEEVDKFLASEIEKIVERIRGMKEYKLFSQEEMIRNQMIEDVIKLIKDL